MVYASWMHQAMEGQFFFVNRFTTDAQPGNMVHIYFWTLGQVAKVTGIPLATELAKLTFTILFVYLLGQLMKRIEASVFTRKLAMTLAVFGAGLGGAVWHNFGQAIVLPNGAFLKPLTSSLLPIDVWQPEAFAFPSLLTSSLFAVSLCLILGVLLSVLRAKDSWRPVIPGALCMAVLMNIHSYDVLIVAVVLVGFLAMMLVQKDAPREWITRAGLIGLGALPPALYFIKVISEDPVFRNRAGVETLSPNFRVVLAGIILLVIPALVALWPSEDDPNAGRKKQGFGLLAALLGLLVVVSTGHTQGMFMTMPVWAVAFVVALVACALLAGVDIGLNLIVSWAILGLVILYFPAAFQRKLGMGLAIPWGLLAAIGWSQILVKQDRNLRNLATALVVMLCSWSSLRWVQRELQLIDLNVSNTTVHTVFLSPDMARIVRAVDKIEGPKVVIAPPGIPAFRVKEGTQEQEPDSFQAPFVSDLNPILTGLAGATTYAGHWGETPDYNRRRALVQKVFLAQTSPEERQAILAEIKPDYIVIPVPAASPDLPFADLSSLGEVVVDGSQFKLLKLTRSN